MRGFIGKSPLTREFPIYDPREDHPGQAPTRIIATPEDRRRGMFPRCGIAQVPTSIRTCALPRFASIPAQGTEPSRIATRGKRGGRRGATPTRVSAASVENRCGTLGGLWFCGLTAPSRIRRSGIISLVKNEQPASGKHILEMKIECGACPAFDAMEFLILTRMYN